MFLLPNPRPVPTLEQIVNELMSRRFSSTVQDTWGGWARGFGNRPPYDSQEVSNLSTSIVEWFLIETGNQALLGSEPLFASRSRSVVKNPDDPYYQNNGYSEVPIGGIFSHVSYFSYLSGDGRIDKESQINYEPNHLTTEPALYIVRSAKRLNKTDLVEKVCQFLDFMTETVQYGEGWEIDLVSARADYGYAYTGEGSPTRKWVKKVDRFRTKDQAKASLCYYLAHEATGIEHYKQKARNLVISTIELLSFLYEDGYLVMVTPMEGVRKTEDGLYQLIADLYSIESIPIVIYLLNMVYNDPEEVAEVNSYIEELQYVSLEDTITGLKRAYSRLWNAGKVSLRDLSARYPNLPYQVVPSYIHEHDVAGYFANDINCLGRGYCGRFFSTDRMFEHVLWLSMIQSNEQTRIEGIDFRWMLWELLRLPEVYKANDSQIQYWGLEYNMNGMPSREFGRYASIASLAMLGLMIKDGETTPIEPPQKIKIVSYTGTTLVLETEKPIVEPIVKTANGVVLEPVEVSDSTNTPGKVYRYEIEGNAMIVIQERSTTQEV